jgi:glucuronate isomerase
MELHIGALRDNSEKMLQQIGPNTGFDSINDRQLAESLGLFLSHVEATDSLPKMVFYTLNRKDNDPVITMAYNFQSAKVNMQFGSAWWFNDNITGMQRQLRDLANNGVLGNFIGMVTDSRSFLSYPRHEYFRRILCNFLGGLVERGEYPADFDILSKIVNGIAYQNSIKYFGVKI